MDGECAGRRALLWSGGSLLSDCDLFPADCFGDQGSAGGPDGRPVGFPPFMGRGGDGTRRSGLLAAGCASCSPLPALPPQPVDGAQLGRPGEPSRVSSLWGWGSVWLPQPEEGMHRRGAEGSEVRGGRR